MDAVTIVAIVIANAVITFVQEFSARRSLESLREMGAPKATVLRDASWKDVPVRELVPGDIVKLATGNIVGADLGILESHQLQMDEAPLTGESEPVEKHAHVLHEMELGVGDRKNMAFMSTLVTGGNGLGVVVETGMRTEVGHIAHLMQSVTATKTPLQLRLDTVAHALFGVAVVVVAVVVGLGLFNGADWMGMLQTAISLSVAAITEGLPTFACLESRRSSGCVGCKKSREVEV